ncbi:MAG: TonB-dependent receptor plug domain-containing protein [Bacteroidetes bacterium]|nr:TonB-dependent receptor plug domain-containing protein [Bacteroidota bacterium]
MVYKKLLVLICFFSSVLIYSQEKDSLKNYNLEEITVKSGIVIEPKTIHVISIEKIVKSDASSLVELGRIIPSVKTQTNSRGESLFFLRGAGERQIALFFDGVPMNIPWDNRIDLSLIPIEAIDEITVIKGIPSIVYGANTVGGAVDISSLNGSIQKSKIGLRFGENNYNYFSGFHGGKFKKFDYFVSGSANKTDGYTLPDSYTNPANERRIRTNSYSERLSLFAKFRYHYEASSNIGLTASYIDSKKGVAPETDVASPRYWQYPLWNKASISLNGSHLLKYLGTSLFTYSFSYYRFKMQIDQFKNIQYNEIDDIEKDFDDVLYGRMIYTYFIDNNSMLKFSLSATSSAHKEKFLSNNFELLTYSQTLFSAGVEYEFTDKKLTAIIGSSLDGSETPQTGDKPAQEGITDFSINSSVIYTLDENINLSLSAGRKTRFPTLREQFSGALGRFIINPELKAEAAINLESGISVSGINSKFDLNFFMSYLNDGIVRTVVVENNVKKFKRINEDKIRTVGLEALFDYKPAEDLELKLNLTLLNSFAENKNGNYSDTLEYKPGIIGGSTINYKLSEQIESSLELNYVGKEFGLKEGSDGYKYLPDYLLSNFRISYSLKVFNESTLIIFARINNIFDKLYFTQWSLPEPGRQFWIGSSIEF